VGFVVDKVTLGQVFSKYFGFSLSISFLHVGFVVDKVALGQVLPEYFGLPLSISFHRCSIRQKNET
jgi:hypothetical protein